MPFIHIFAYVRSAGKPYGKPLCGFHTYQVQVVSWYDNENSYTSQMVRTIKYFAELNESVW
ncbi:MAG: hypothetical protein IJ354_00165 [Clostridia bacterium]|nr:hypothetical protein [Clostridia bacterium]